MCMYVSSLHALTNGVLYVGPTVWGPASWIQDPGSWIQHPNGAVVKSHKSYFVGTTAKSQKAYVLGTTVKSHGSYFVGGIVKVPPI